MFVIRSIKEKDLADFYRLASILDTYNLPKNRKLLAEIIHRSLDSFYGSLSNLHLGRYVFVAEDLDKGRIVGTSEILAKRGVKGHPFICCNVGVDHMKSSTLRKEMTHRYIRLASTFDGATEVGGLVVDPRYRGRGSGVGKALSYVRFMYMKMHPSKFQKRVLAELLAYLDSRGENPLWNFLGRHFTGLSYRDADHLSASNKEFILSLFPSEKIYTCLLPERVQKKLEVPGPESMPAKILLERIGFKYLQQIDPFDGGPLYGAKTDEISIYRNTKRYKYAGICDQNLNEEGLLLFEKNGKIRACKSDVERVGKKISIHSDGVEALQIKQGDVIWMCLV